MAISDFIQTLVRIFSWIGLTGVGTFLIIPPVLLLIYLLVGRKFKKSAAVEEKDFGVVITAHEDSRFIDPIVQSLLKQNYSHFQIYVVADKCDPKSIPAYEGSPVTMLLPKEPINSKVRSIRYAIDQFQRNHDVILIFDVDNLAHGDMLREMNGLFQKGYKAVQADFRAKNLNTPFARMDAIGDLYNFFVDREARAALGLSAAIWGSGIAVDLDIYQSVSYQDDLGGFDKKLQLHIMEKAGKIGFTPLAFLYDEKISTGAALERQRTRWLSSQFKYFKESVSFLFRSIIRLRFDHFFFALNALRPPLIIQLGIITLIALINLVIGSFWLAGIAGGLLLLYAISFFLIVAVRSRWNKAILGTFLLLPKFAIRQAGALLKINQARKSFLKTQQENVIYIEEIQDPLIK